MSDIKCVKCGEPWDAYGVTHGDMLFWEAKLFKLGAGCPSCEGVSNGWEPKSIFDLENGDGDEGERLAACESKVAWVRPGNPVHWTCDGCGVEAVTDLDTGDLEYHVPYKSKASSWYTSHAYLRQGTPDKEPAHTFGTETHVCEVCLDHCADCGAAISSVIEGDVYDDGYSIGMPGSHTECLCTDCFEHNWCTECESRNEDCSCHSEEDEESDEEEPEDDDGGCHNCGSPDHTLHPTD